MVNTEELAVIARVVAQEVQHQLEMHRIEDHSERLVAHLTTPHHVSDEDVSAELDHSEDGTDRSSS